MTLNDIPTNYFADVEQWLPKGHVLAQRPASARQMSTESRPLMPLAACGGRCAAPA